jgi:hypothetical protein
MRRGRQKIKNKKMMKERKKTKKKMKVSPNWFG